MTSAQQQIMSATATVEDVGLFSMQVPLLTECMFGLIFAISFAFLRGFGPGGQQNKKVQKGGKSGKTVASPAKLIADRFAADDMEGVVSIFRTKHIAMPVQVDTLKTVVRALLSVDPASLVGEVMQHMKAHAKELGNLSTANVVMDAMALCEGGMVAMEPMWHALSKEFSLTRNTATKESFLCGYAWAGEESSVVALIAEMEAERLRISARTYSCVVRGFLKHGFTEAALKQMLIMASHGYNVHPAAVVAVTRQSIAMDRTKAFVEKAHGILTFTSEAVAILLEDCLHKDNFACAVLVHDSATASHTTLSGSAYDSLLKMYAAAGDARAPLLFTAMQHTGLRISDGLCVSLISRCAIPKFRRFAEDVVAFARAQGKMTMNMYSSLMKVYAYEGLFEAACGLYDQLVEEGLEADSMMYGCLLKFALQCGRTDLLAKFSAGITSSVDVQHVTLRIRAAGQAKDADKAFAFFRELEATEANLDVTVHNVLLDACVAAGAMDRARKHVNEMPKGLADEVTYNVLLKGYCAVGDADHALDVLGEMEAKGCSPSTTAYNCLLNMDISWGNPARAWKTIAVMEKRGVPVDKYTVSTMIKSLKASQNPAKDLHSILAMLDRSGLNICGDDILLNTVLEACCRQRMFQRIKEFLAMWEVCPLAKCAAMHTHAVVIKAYSLIHRVDRCREVWDHLVKERCLEPSNIVIGCMLDALVCNSCADEAVKVFFSLKEQGREMNPVMYSTVLKGMLNQCSPSSVVKMFEEMRAEGVQPNTSSYNCAIDAYLREGKADCATALMAEMGGCGCEANESTHAIVIKTQCANGDLDKAWEVFRSIKVNIQVYNTLLDCAIQSQRMDIARTLVEEMDNYKLKPTSFTLVNHIKYYGRIKNADAAFRVVETWEEKYNVVPNMAAKTSLVRTCMHSGATQLGEKVMQEIMQSEAKLDEKSWRSLMLSCIQGNLLDQAVAIVEGLFGLEPLQPLAAGFLSRPKKVAGGKALPLDVLETLFRALVKQGHRESMAQPLEKKLQAQGMKFTNPLPGSSLGAKGAPWRSRA